MKTTNPLFQIRRATCAMSLVMSVVFAVALQGAPSPGPSSDSGKPVFQEVVLPFMEKYCVPCHSSERARGQLRVNTWEGIQKGGKSGSFHDFKNPSEFPLLKRILLPIEDGDHMPPAKKPQPSAEEIAIIQWWIQAGADGEKSVAQLNPPESIQLLLTSKNRPVQDAKAETTPPKARNEVLPLAEQLADKLGIAISPLSENDAWLQVNASLAGASFNDSSLAQLEPLTLNLRWLNLGGTAISDTGLAHVKKMKNLTRLHLERTSLTDAGLTQLTSLTQLEYLNLYATRITDAGLNALRSLHSLRRVFLWQTQVTPDAAKALGEALEDKDQIRKWEEEIALLKAKINRQIVLVDTGLQLKTKSTNAVPINTQCPVSGKSIDLAKTTQYEGHLIAFCCDDCKAAFEKDPKAYLAKLNTKESKLLNKE